MPRPRHRVRPLNDAEKRKFLEIHIPGRVKLVDLALRRMGRNHCHFSYYHFTVAAVHARVLAQFLGLKISKNGALAQDREYFQHEGNDSFEVKLPDVCRLPLLDPAAFSSNDKRALEIGFDTINREVAHFTCWDSKPRHHALDVSTANYYDNLIARLRTFCEIILREIKKCQTDA